MSAEEKFTAAWDRLTGRADEERDEALAALDREERDSRALASKLDSAQHALRKAQAVIEKAIEDECYEGRTAAEAALSIRAALAEPVTPIPEWKCPDCGGGITKIHATTHGLVGCGMPPGYWANLGRAVEDYDTPEARARRDEIREATEAAEPVTGTPCSQSERRIRPGSIWALSDSTGEQVEVVGKGLGVVVLRPLGKGGEKERWPGREFVANFVPVTGASPLPHGVYVGTRNSNEGMAGEANCTCGWSVSTDTLSEAHDAAERHREEPGTPSPEADGIELKWGLERGDGTTIPLTAEQAENAARILAAPRDPGALDPTESPCWCGATKRWHGPTVAHDFKAAPLPLDPKGIEAAAKAIYETNRPWMERANPHCDFARWHDLSLESGERADNLKNAEAGIRAYLAATGDGEQ